MLSRARLLTITLVLGIGLLSVLSPAADAGSGGAGGSKLGKVRRFGGQAQESGTIRKTITVGGVERSYLLHVPASVSGKGPVPLVLVFHGGGGNGQNAATMSGFSAKADQAGFIAVYPNGSGPGDKDVLLTWNAGGCCGYAREHNIDDVAFIRQLVAQLQKDHAIDPRRIYATGMSNGGGISYTAGCALSDIFAAIAPVSSVAYLEHCQPAQPLSVFAIHGTADTHVPYHGGIGASAFLKDVRPSVHAVVAHWVAADGCNPEAIRTENTHQILERWSGGNAGTEVVLLTAKGLGHVWPGGQKGRAVADDPGTAIHATDLIWDFFVAHPKR